MAHDLIFFEKRSTPKVVTKGESFDAPEDYGKQTSRRAATEEEEKTIARGDWVRVDEKGNKGGEDGYKKTKMPGREHLVKHAEDTDVFLAHYGVRGMKWGVTRTKVKGALGQRTEAVGRPSKEAKATAKTNAKAKAQKSTQALTNKQLKDAIARMELEQKYSKLTGNIDKTAQQKAAIFINDLVKTQGKQNLNNAVSTQVRNNIPGGQQNSRGQQQDNQNQQKKRNGPGYTPPNRDASFTITDL